MDSAAGKRTVLVVDDTPANIQIVVASLKDDYKVKVANSGAKALSLARSDSPPDLILLDIMMPEMDGYEVCRQLKADPATSQIPVIFLTAMTDVADETLGFELGAVDYVHKPFSPPVVQARVRTQMGLLEARQQLAQEKELVDRLLDSLLPAAAVTELKAHGRVEPRLFDNVAVLFCDLVSFTRFCSQHTPAEVVSNLDALFLMFETCAEKHGLEKIKTIGDAFLATAGLLRPCADPLSAAVACAREIVEGAIGLGWGIRTGVHLGTVMAGVVGRERYQFDLWGDTVNVAARLAAVAATGGVALTEAMGERLQGVPLNSMGEVQVKGKGPMRLVQVGPASSAHVA